LQTRSLSSQVRKNFCHELLDRYRNNRNFLLLNFTSEILTNIEIEHDGIYAYDVYIIIIL